MPMPAPSLTRSPGPCAALLLGGLWLHASAFAQSNTHDALQDQVAEVARDWLRAHVQEQGIQATQLRADVIPSAKRPAPCSQQRQIAILKTMPGRVLVAVDCPSDTAGQSRYIVRTSVRAKALVARTAIAGGRVLEADMFDSSEQDITLSPDAATDPAQVVGRSIRRPLTTGKLLLTRYLASEHGVRRGQPVRITAGAPGFQISIAGTALADAGPGESVVVRNQSTGKTLAARVSSDGVVEPAMEMQ